MAISLFGCILDKLSSKKRVKNTANKLIQEMNEAIQSKT